MPHTKRARVAAHRRRRSSSPRSTLRTHSTTQRSQTRTPALLSSLQSPLTTVRRRCAAGAAGNELEGGKMVDKSTSQNRGHRHSLGCSLHRPQNRPEPANTGWRGRATVRPDRLSPKLPVNGGRGAPRAMRAPDGDPTATAAVSSSPRDTVSAPCRGSRPGPAALDRPPQSRGPAPARPGRYGRPDESSTGGQRREVAMGKGLPGGRRQAGSIDYRTEVRRFVLRL